MRENGARRLAPRALSNCGLFPAAFHCHDDGPHPRVSDRFDAALIWRAGSDGTDHMDLTVHQY
ncbi:hypothetical protein [Streptomyces sp. NPDC018000]|uniref:hypothetical protein n=1 Tax=Streptomyces sp. NPDC018000 TaxID=3365028 RepID=UPI003799EE97